MGWMKSLQYLLYLTPMACLLAQTPPPSQPATPPAQGQAAPGAPHAATLPPAAPAPQVPPDKVVLTVGEEKITAEQFDHYLDIVPEQYRSQFRTPAGRRRFAENVTQAIIMAQEAHRRNLDQSPLFKDEMALQTDSVLSQLLTREMMSTTKVDEAAERAYFDQHKEEYVLIKASHILIRFKGSTLPAKPGQKELTEEEALAKAQEIRKKIVDGGDFAAIAKAESDDVVSGPKGGDLGPPFGHGRMQPPFEAAAFKLSVGEVSEPVKTQLGYHIIKVEQKTEKTFVEVKPQLDRSMPAEIVRKTIDNLKTSTPVVMDTDYFGPATPPPPSMSPAVKPPTLRQ
jgi:peptidyl-prolyl cis-trans isomerase C